MIPYLIGAGVVGSILYFLKKRRNNKELGRSLSDGFAIGVYSDCPPSGANEINNQRRSVDDGNNLYQHYPSPYEAATDQLVYNPYFNKNKTPRPQLQPVQPQNNQIVQFNPNQINNQPPIARQPMELPLIPQYQQQHQHQLQQHQQRPIQPQQQQQPLPQPPIQQQPVKSKQTYNPNPQLPLQLKPVMQIKSPFQQNQSQNQQVKNNNPIPLLPLPNNNNYNLIPPPPPSITIQEIKAKKAPIIINRYLNAPIHPLPLPLPQQQQPKQPLQHLQLPLQQNQNQKQYQSPINNNYEIKYSELSFGKCLGEGAFGRVYEGRWNNSPVALKTLICNLNESTVNDFKSEIKVLSLLRHPNICLFMGACTVSPHFVIVSELIKKGSLWNLLHDYNIEIDMKLVIKLALGTAYGMNYLHTKNPPLIHRDLKSANLLVDDSYNIKISDFGLCRVRAYSETMTGNCGTYQWMAPEILKNSYYSEKADVYSYGIVIWELISRDCPYNGLDGIQVAIGVLNDKIRPNIPVNCPLNYKELICKCWNDDANVRPSFSEIIKILEKLRY